MPLIITTFGKSVTKLEILISSAASGDENPAPLHADRHSPRSNKNRYEAMCKLEDYRNIIQNYHPLTKGQGGEQVGN